jgi:hypothetical protein
MVCQTPVATVMYDAGTGTCAEVVDHHMRGCMFLGESTAGLSPQTTRADALLSDFWTRKPEQVSRELYKHA